MNKKVELVGRDRKEIELYSFDEYNYKNIPASFFLTEDEIVDDLFHDRLGSYMLELLERYEAAELIRLHSTLGMDIRNLYGMWHPNNPHTEFADVMSPHFPDQYSFSVIKKLHKKLTGA